ncbi:Uncharacterised protein [Escherichia coli]|uniref:Uncharacterized protein n=1 Tax=Escherichia coli TaxID=562 RepID=A0A376L5S5_ECOLX|nr:Uncharacterised protein [Escherichia coli]
MVGGQESRLLLWMLSDRLLKAMFMLFFDADYLPAPGLLKQIVAPLFDPQIGVTIGQSCASKYGEKTF